MRGFEKVDKVLEWHRNLNIEKTIKALHKRGYKAQSFASKEECTSYLMEIVSEDLTVSCGGSATIAQMSLLEKLEKKGVKVISSFRSGLSKEEQFEEMKKGMLVDVFFSGINAITTDGLLYFIDGVGNRVSSIIFGPKKTILIVGDNKIVHSIEEAKRRVKEIAAPMNIRRYYKEGKVFPPCAKTGVCTQCNPPLSACNIEVMLNAKPSASDIEVLIIAEHLGF